MLGYLDAGGASMIFSAIAAGAAGILVVVKMMWRRTLGKLSPKRRREVAAVDPATVDASAASAPADAPVASAAASDTP
jgi:hypothetical protein